MERKTELSRTPLHDKGSIKAFTQQHLTAKVTPKIQNQIAKQTTTSILFHPKKVVIMLIS